VAGRPLGAPGRVSSFGWAAPMPTSSSRQSSGDPRATPAGAELPPAPGTDRAVMSEHLVPLGETAGRCGGVLLRGTGFRSTGLTRSPRRTARAPPTVSWPARSTAVVRQGVRADVAASARPAANWPPTAVPRGDHVADATAMIAPGTDCCDRGSPNSKRDSGTHDRPVLQRYCAKNETIGSSAVRLGPPSIRPQPGSRPRPGPGLVRA